MDKLISFTRSAIIGGIETEKFCPVCYIFETRLAVRPLTPFGSSTVSAYNMVRYQGYHLAFQAVEQYIDRHVCQYVDVELF